MRFTFDLLGVGWAEARLQSEHRVVDLRGGYCTDASGDLLRALLRLFDGSIEERFSWDDEPREYRWVFSRSADKETLKILEFEIIHEHLPDIEGTLLFVAQESLGMVAIGICDGYDRYLADHGVEAYNQEWKLNSFPEADLEALRGLAETIAS